MMRISLVGLFRNNLFHAAEISYPGRHTIPGLFDKCLVHRQFAISVHWLQQRICLFFLHFILYAEALECLQNNDNDKYKLNVSWFKKKSTLQVRF